MQVQEDTGNGNESDFLLNGSLPVYNIIILPNVTWDKDRNYSNVPDDEDLSNFLYPGTIKVCAPTNIIIVSGSG